MGYTQLPDLKLCTCADQANIPTYKRELKQINKFVNTMTYTYELSPEGYKELENGTRTFLLLKDKGYKVGDIFLVQEPLARKELKMEIQYTEKAVPGLKGTFLILGLKEKE